MRTLFCLGLIIALAPPCVAQSERPQFCETLQEMRDGTDLDVLTQTLGADSCDTFLALGAGRTAVCQWEFTLRVNAASAFFGTLVADTKPCLENSVQSPTGKPVNHPDSYYLFQMQSDGLNVAISLKDKTALGQSWVFLRVAQK